VTQTQALARFVRAHPRLLVLTGAGVSTASGIPDYRDAEGQWKRTPPLSHQEFLRSELARRRYWARSLIGWPRVAAARPNAAHRALARLESAGCVHTLLTQNVDGLHQRAGSRGVIELHGSLERVLCLDCGEALPRAAVQRILEAQNPAFLSLPAGLAPDGDADVALADLDDFRVPECLRCGGLLKPDVVFFGAGVPPARVDAALQALASADALLVVGSSLMVYSGYRFCLAAREMGKPIAAINLGRTRADELLQLKIVAPCAVVLAELARALFQARAEL
jgi:NAD-dependent SIR2 family protein deacetylase